MKQFFKISILVCTHTSLGVQNKSCGGAASQNIVKKLKQMIIDNDLNITVREQACFGRCEEGVVVRIYPGKEFFTHVTEHSLPKIVKIANSYVV